MSHSELSYTDFRLPSEIVSRIDVAALATEAERVDNGYTSAAVHDKIQQSSSEVTTPSPQLQLFLDSNQLSFDDDQTRRQIIAELRRLKDKVPVIHMTFPAEVDQDSLQRLCTWVRESVHPQAVLAIGRQPALIAGVYVRTANKVFDKTVRAKLKAGRHYLAEELEALRGQ